MVEPPREAGAEVALDGVTADVAVEEAGVAQERVRAGGEEGPRLHASSPEVDSTSVDDSSTTRRLLERKGRRSRGEVKERPTPGKRTPQNKNDGFRRSSRAPAPGPPPPRPDCPHDGETPNEDEVPLARCRRATAAVSLADGAAPTATALGSCILEFK
ncbi:hypothetical protein ACHAWF_016108 [Thalassiosira exigua]